MNNTFNHEEVHTYVKYRNLGGRKAQDNCFVIETGSGM